MSLSFTKTLSLCLPICLAAVSFMVLMLPNQSFATPCVGYLTPSPGPYGTDVCETEPYYCYEGMNCCSIASTNTIAQNQFADYRRSFVMDSFYKNTVETDFKSRADEGRKPALFKMAVWGAFIDASILNDTLKDLGILKTQSIQAYVPSEQICRVGTLSRSLAASEAKVNADRLILSEAGLAKNLGRANMISTAGSGQENQLRIRGFIELFCDIKDSNNGLSEACQTATPVVDLQLNRDIDYARLMDNGVTLNADLADFNSTQDKTNIFAMSHFLYGHRLPDKRISLTEFGEKESTQNLYGEYRSVAARRAAAQNTFNTQAAMKMAGSGGSEAYLRAVLRNIGIDGGDSDRYLGGQNSAYTFVNTSYNAQMNMLTKQIYQDPAFYANLMDSKANVKRTSAALQGIGLMQQRDTYKSMARSEMLAAILVELEARKIANNVQGTKTQ